tara:strand:+ start:10454 stop:11440 length:987 start_codon:yes stop_codon:yes gene_type:complete
MAFLNNSGDIILDAVLTDLGRKRLAQGDGSFKIGQFALGDDEIDYGQYNLTTGSAYQDLDILQTPILEAITDNVSSMKSKLVTYSRTDLLYLPIEKLNTDSGRNGTNTGSLGVFVALVNTESDFVTGNKNNTIYGYSSVTNKSLAEGNFFARSQGSPKVNPICQQQGLDTTQVSFTFALDQTLTETDYFVYMDNRLGQPTNVQNGVPLEPSYIDDDNIATYIISQGNASNSTNFTTVKTATAADTSSPSIISGPYNKQQLQFSIYASDNLAYSDFLFEKFGNTADVAASSGGSAYTTVYSIDTDVRVVGAKTGYSLSIPVRFVKIKTF